MRTDPNYITQRHLEVINLLRLGLKNQEIADRLFIELKTVKYHLTNIYKILGVKSRSELMAHLITLGLRETDVIINAEIKGTKLMAIEGKYVAYPRTQAT